MTARNSRPVAWIVAAAALLAAGCSHDQGTLQLAATNTDPVVFGDTFGSNVIYQAFLGSKLDAVAIDPTDSHSGTASLKVTVPGPGSYAGGAFTTGRVRNLSGYNALTFWAKASRTASLDVAGLGNDNTGTSKYVALWTNIALTPTWTRYVIPIPNASRLIDEGGLFTFADSAAVAGGYTVWFDDIVYDNVAAIANPRPSMASQTLAAVVGGTVTVTGTQTIFAVGGSDETIQHSPGYFDFSASNDTVVAVTDNVIRVIGTGSTTITARLVTVPATGTVTVNATAPPTVAAPTPTVPAADVISLFSNAYTNVPVDTWSASWDNADVADLLIAGNATKVYTNLVTAGIEFTSPTIDATGMTAFHIDVWIPAGNVFRIKLVDFGANGVYGGGDDSEHQLFFNVATDPPLVLGQWLSLDLPLADFVGLSSRAHLAQLILSGDTSIVYVDNVYFHR